MKRRVTHSNLGICHLTEQTDHMNNQNPDPSSIFVEYDGDIREVSRSLVSEVFQCDLNVSVEELGACKNFRRLGERHPKAKLTAQMVQEIRTQYSEGRLDAKQLSEELGVSRTNIYRIVKRTIWRSLP